MPDYNIQPDFDPEGLSEEELAELLPLLEQLPQAQGQAMDAQKQMEIARMLRNTPMADTTVSAGRLVMPNYAGALDTALSRYRGGKQMKEAAADRDAALDILGRGRAAMAKAAMGRGRPDYFQRPGNTLNDVMNNVPQYEYE